MGWKVKKREATVAGVSPGHNDRRESSSRTERARDEGTMTVDG